MAKSKLICPHCKEPFDSVEYHQDRTESGRLFLLENGEVAEWKEDESDADKTTFLCRSCGEKIKAKFIDGIFTVLKK